MVPPVEIELLTFEVCLTLAMMRQLFTHWKFVFKHFHQMNWKNAVMLMLFCMMVDPQEQNGQDSKPENHDTSERM